MLIKKEHRITECDIWAQNHFSSYLGNKEGLALLRLCLLLLLAMPPLHKPQEN